MPKIAGFSKVVNSMAYMQDTFAVLKEVKAIS